MTRSASGGTGQPENTLPLLSAWDDARIMLEKAAADGVETTWDRLEKQKNYRTFCEQGLTCQKCVMGPCRIMGEGAKKKDGV
jgi:carbon-monoxide dehydrogenase catalytic subunit